MSDDKSIVSFLPLHYDGHQVRTVIDEPGFFWWVAQDVGDILGLQNVRQNLTDFPSDEKSVCTVYTSSGAREALTVNEPGLYRLIFQSRKPEAEVLKRWVFHDILPMLRRTGSYPMAGISSHAPDSLTPGGQLPPPAPRPREHAEVSWHMAAVWRLLRLCDEWLSNKEIAARIGIAARTVRAHTRYFRQLGLIEVHEYFPHHLHRVALDADLRHPGVYQRLEEITALIEARRRP